MLLRTLDALGLGVRLVSGVDGEARPAGRGCGDECCGAPARARARAARQVVAGAHHGYAELDVSADGTRELGVWEMTAGAMRDVEADEVFLVIAGRATVEFVDPALR